MGLIKSSTDAILIILIWRRGGQWGLLGDPEREQLTCTLPSGEEAASGVVARPRSAAALTPVLYHLEKKRPVGLLGVPGSKKTPLPIQK